MRYYYSGAGRSKSITSGTGSSTGNVFLFAKNFTIPEEYRIENVPFICTITSTRNSSVCTNHSAELSLSTISSDDNTSNTSVGCFPGNQGYGSNTATLSVNCSGATKIYTRVYASVTATYQGSNNGTQTASQTITITIIAPWGIETELIITAAKINEIASALDYTLSPIPTIGANITRAQYQNLSDEVSANTFDTTKPLAIDLQSLIEKAGQNLNGTWN